MEYKEKNYEIPSNEEELLELIKRVENMSKTELLKKLNLKSIKEFKEKIGIINQVSRSLLEKEGKENA